MKCVQGGGHQLSKDRHKHSWELTKEQGKANVYNIGMGRERAEEIGYALLVCEALNYRA